MLIFVMGVGLAAVTAGTAFFVCRPDLDPSRAAVVGVTSGVLVGLLWPLMRHLVIGAFLGAVVVFLLLRRRTSMRTTLLASGGSFVVLAAVTEGLSLLSPESM